jgi:hypothetical protein
MSRPQKYTDEFIQSVLDRRAAGELIEDIARDCDMEGTTLSKLINRRHGYIRKETNLNLALANQRKKNRIAKAGMKRKEAMRHFTLHLDKEIYETVKLMAVSADKKLSVLLRELIESELKRISEEKA